MKLSAFSTFAVVAFWMAAQPAAATPDEAGLRAADAEEARIIAEGDAAAQQASMHDNFMITTASNQVQRKPELVRMLAARAVRVDPFERVIEALQITGTVGVVMGRETVRPSAGSPTMRRFTNVFLYEGDRWRFLARQATVAGTAK